MGSYEIVEHTADVGIVARASTLAELFEQAARGLADISGTWTPGTAEKRVQIDLDSRDLEGLMVDWLNELMYLQEIHDAHYASVDVTEISEQQLRATIGLSVGKEWTGTAVKAATFHKLVVEQRSDEWFTRVYVDV